MSQIAATTRHFSVRVRPSDGHHPRILEEVSFEAAAIAYLEGFQSPTDDDQMISVSVREIGTDHEHCFRIDLAAGNVAPCS